MNNNVFNLTDYFKEEYGYTFTTISDLLTAPFIEYEGTGAFALFWVTMQNEKYLFKEVNKSTYTWLGELLSEEYAKILDIPCAEYKICKLGDKYGILSKKFTKSNESVILGAEIIQNVLDKYPYLLREHLLEDEYFLDLYNIPESIVQMKREHRLKYLYNNLNNIEELWSIISIYLDLHKQDKQFEKKFISHMTKVFLFDLLTLQCDRHIGNWGIIENQDTKQLSTTPLFDNSASFTLYDENMNKRITNFYEALNAHKIYDSEKSLNQFINFLYKDRLLLTPSEDAITNPKAKKRENNLKVLDYFLANSSKEYIIVFEEMINKIKNISLEEILIHIESNQNIKIDERVKRYLIDLNEQNLYFLEEKVKQHLEKQERGI